MMCLAGMFVLHGGALDDAELRAARLIRDRLAGPGADAAPVRSGAGSLLLGGEAGRTGAVTAAVTGRIANARALRRELAVLGVEVGSGQAALICAAWQAWGADLGAHLDGAFAFVLVDATSGTLLCGRDRHGAEPFYVTLLPDRICFASDLAALLLWPGVRRGPDHEALAHYLTFGFCPDNQAPIYGVQALPPAHRLLAEPLRAPRIEAWSATGSATEEPVTAGRPHGPLDAPGLRALFDRAAAGVLTDADDVGILLAGDLASAALAEAFGRAGARATTVAIGTGPEPTFAPRGLRGRSVALGPDHARAVLDGIGRDGDLRGGCEAIAAEALVSAAAESHAVAVSAAGGSELLHDRAHHRNFAAAVRHFRDNRGRLPVRQEFYTTSPFLRDLYADALCLCSSAERLAMTGPGLIGTLLFSPADAIGPTLERADAGNARALAARVDLTHGAPRVLAPLRAARMRSGLGLHAPLLEPAFADPCRAGTETGGEAGDLLWASLDGPRAAPPAAVGPALGLWLRTALRERLEDTLLSAAFRARELFRQPWIEAQLRANRAGTGANPQLLWAILCLETWFADILDRGPARGARGAAGRAEALA